MSDETLYTLLAKHFAGECTESELLVLNAWVNNESHLNLFRKLQQEWNEQQPEPTPLFEVSKGWLKVKSKLES